MLQAIVCIGCQSGFLDQIVGLVKPICDRPIPCHVREALFNHCQDELKRTRSQVCLGVMRLLIGEDSELGRRIDGDCMKLLTEILAHAEKKSSILELFAGLLKGRVVRN
jgi:hypothetical protein